MPLLSGYSRKSLFKHLFVCLFMAAGKVHVRNITNRTAALLLFMPASVISVLLLKGEI